MANDPFQDLLELEDEFYTEGYDAGVADSMYAGMIEGKVFGIEKGYAKALELAKLYGRAIVWRTRLPNSPQNTGCEFDGHLDKRSDRSTTTDVPTKLPLHQLDLLPSSTRLQRHIETLLSLTDSSSVRPENTDEAVTEYDDRLAKARAKAKIISNATGEALSPASATEPGIEDATGLKARQ